jgi:hypothetical protein
MINLYLLPARVNRPDYPNADLLPVFYFLGGLVAFSLARLKAQFSGDFLNAGTFRQDRHQHFFVFAD